MEKTEERYAALGKIYTLRSSVQLATSAEQSRNLLYAVRAGNYHLLHDDQQSLIGYVTWAAINRDGWRMLQCQQPPRYLSEWSEGRVMLPMDVVVLPEWRTALQRLLRPVCRRMPQLAAWRAGQQPRLYRVLRRGNHD